MSCIKIDGIEIEVIRKNIKNMHYMSSARWQGEDYSACEIKRRCHKNFATSNWIDCKTSQNTCTKMQPKEV